MIFPGSRYETTRTYTTKTRSGRTVTALAERVLEPRNLAGYHLRMQGQRLDHIAARYLSDATRFWELCDSAGAISPDALAARTRVPVPVKK